MLNSVVLSGVVLSGVVLSVVVLVCFEVVWCNLKYVVWRGGNWRVFL